MPIRYRDLPQDLSVQIHKEMMAAVAGERRIPDWVFNQPPDPQPISREERIQGLAALWAEARVAFAYWDKVPDLDWDAAFREFLPQVIAAEDPAEYYRLLRRFMVLLQDGHTWVSAPLWLREQEAPPPLEVYPVEGEPVVLRGEGLPPGSVVTRVDGEAAHGRLQAIMAEETASTDHFRLLKACGKLLKGPRGSAVTVEARQPDGSTTTVRLSALALCRTLRWWSGWIWAAAACWCASTPGPTRRWWNASTPRWGTSVGSRC